jgi:hypothetical protein
MTSLYTHLANHTNCTLSTSKISFSLLLLCPAVLPCPSNTPISSHSPSPSSSSQTKVPPLSDCIIPNHAHNNKNDTDNAREIFQQMKMLIGKRVEKRA